MNELEKRELAAYCVEQYLKCIRYGDFRSAVRIIEHLHRLTLLFAFQEERELVGFPIIKLPDV